MQLGELFFSLLNFSSVYYIAALEDAVADFSSVNYIVALDFDFSRGAYIFVVVAWSPKSVRGS